MLSSQGLSTGVSSFPAPSSPPAGLQKTFSSRRDLNTTRWSAPSPSSPLNLTLSSPNSINTAAKWSPERLASSIMIAQTFILRPKRRMTFPTRRPMKRISPQGNTVSANSTSLPRSSRWACSWTILESPAICINRGNKNKQQTLIPLEEKLLQDFGLARFVVCTAAGLSSKANRKFNNFDIHDILAINYGRWEIEESFRIIKDDFGDLYEYDVDLTENSHRAENSTPEFEIHDSTEKEQFKNDFFDGQSFKCFETNSGEDMILTIYLFYDSDKMAICLACISFILLIRNIGSSAFSCPVTPSLSVV